MRTSDLFEMLAGLIRTPGFAAAKPGVMAATLQG
jgi:hypothetical protein